MRALLAIATLIPLSAWSGPGCSPTQSAPPPEPTTMPGMPDHDAGSSSIASCKTACGTIDTTLHCDGHDADHPRMWTAGQTCMHQCENLTGRVSVPHLLTCWTRSKSCATAHNCQE